MTRRVQLVVYGAKEKCASCVQLPSALETKEWLEAALQRKYPNNQISVRYVDIHAKLRADERYYAEEILNSVYFYPLVVLNNEVVAEGNPKLKVIYEKIEALLYE